MTRVAFFTFEFPPLVNGGAGVYAARLIPELLQLGTEVTIFTRKASRPPVTGLRVRGVSEPGWGAVGYWACAPLAYLQDVDRHGAFDIVHGSGVGDFTVLRGIDSVPRVVTVHHLSADAPEGVLDRPRSKLRGLRGEGGIVPLVEQLVVRRADHLIAVSNATKSALRRRFAIPEQRITVIHHGVDQTVEIESPQLAKSAFGPSGSILLLSVGRLEYRKGPDVLLEAVTHLVGKGYDIRVILAGSGPLHEYERLAIGLGLRDRVTLTGWVDERQKQALYQVCDIYVVPSRLEGFGLTALEAMAAGKPVVSTPIGATQDGLIDEDCGGIAGEATSAALAAAIERCIVRLRGDARLGLRNQDRVAELTWERAGRRTKVLYDELIAAPPRHE